MVNRLGIDECRLRKKLVLNGAELAITRLRNLTKDKLVYYEISYYEYIRIV